MYHDNIDVRAAQPLVVATERKPGLASIAMATLIVLSLPLLGLWMMAGVLLRDMRMLGRAFGICVQTYAAEFSRRR